MESEIFLPMYYLMLLTVTVLLFSITVRLKEIYVNKTVDGEAHRHPPFDEGSRLLKNSQRNLVLHCLHLYFCYGKSRCLFYYFSIRVFYFRVAHSIYHIFFNQLIIKGGFPIRSLLWIPSTATMVWMWVRFISLV